tara:strand:+ start:996 stop:1310 length:315 start_codon:yes stop_codon:yes gene_type:complete
VSKDLTLKERIKLAIEQLNGKIPYKTQEELDSIELLPEYAIKGTGYMYCFAPGKKRFVRICRGQKVYIIDDVLESSDKYLVYTWDGFLVEIEIEELLEYQLGFD